MKKIALMVFVLATALVGCGDKGSTSSDDATTTTPLSGQYYHLNKGLCYDNLNNRAHSNQCAGLQGYYQVNGYCYGPSNNRIADTYCQRNPIYVRPSCSGNNFYSFRQGRRVAVNCTMYGCQGRRVFDGQGRHFLCR